MIGTLLDAVVDAHTGYEVVSWLKDSRTKPLRSFKPQFAMAIAAVMIACLFAATYFVR